MFEQPYRCGTQYDLLKWDFHPSQEFIFRLKIAKDENGQVNFGVELT